jgi:peptidoglycan/LPS O-acetylase OafA/YrhL
MVLLGEASYSCYILQFPVGLTFRFFYFVFILKDYYGSTVQPGWTHGLAAYVILVTLLISVSIAVLRGYEIPMRMLLKERLHRSLLRIR